MQDYIILQYGAGFFTFVSVLLLVIIGTLFGVVLLTSIDAYASMSWGIPIFVKLIQKYLIGLYYYFICCIVTFHEFICYGS